jgi:hypothetical protein
MRQSILLVLSLFWAGMANSASLKNPIIDGREWMQVSSLVNYSWNDFSALCSESSGDCSGSLSGGQYLDGWTWAGVAEVNALASHYIGAYRLGPAPQRFSTEEYYGDLIPGAGFADRFLDDFSPTDSSLPVTIQGAVRDLDQIMVWDNFQSWNRPMDLYASFNALAPLAAESGVLVSFDPALRSSGSGGWFYRPSEVPLPAAVWLFGSAILGLGFLKRKKGTDKLTS